MRSRAVALIFLGISGYVLVGSEPAGAQVYVIDQSRTVQTRGPNTDSNHMDTAAPFAPFNDTVHKTGSFTGIQTAGNTVFFDALAWQSSTIDLTGQTLHVSASGLTSFSVVGPTSSPTSAGGITNYSVTFQVSSPATYTIEEQTDHQTETAPFTDNEAYSEGARLQLGASDLIPFPLWNQSSAAPVTFTGTLAPGTYVFSGGAFAYDLIEQGTSGFAADLTVESLPEPAGLLPFALGVLTLCRKRRYWQ